jgi:hypothetical protein
MSNSRQKKVKKKKSAREQRMIKDVEGRSRERKRERAYQ